MDRFKTLPFCMHDWRATGGFWIKLPTNTSTKRSLI
jgi:hypothetical protein